MRHSEESAAPVVALALIAGLVLLGGAGGVFLWQAQRAQLQAERARAMEARAMAEQARARAMAIAQQQMSQATSGASTPSAGDARAESDAARSAEAAILSVLQTQQQAWNEGDIDRFMEYYWKSADLTFSAGGSVTRGWQGTLDNYKQRYPTRSDMGEVSFQNLEVSPLGADAAMVLGQWQLSRETGDLSGNFTLLFRRLDDGWVIVHDHTSRKEEP